MTSISGFEEMAEDLEDFADGLEEVSARMDEVQGNVTTQTTVYIAALTRENAPVDEGLLQNSIIAVSMSHGVAVISVLAPYGRYVEYGTRPHVIPPSPKTTYDEPVMHPGAEPHPFLRPAMHRGSREMHDIFADELERLFREVF